MTYVILSLSISELILLKVIRASYAVEDPPGRPSIV